MQLQPYQITSALFAVINQRLLRRRHNDSYHGRVPIAESVTLTDALRRAILDKADATSLTEIIHRQPDHLTLRAAARRLIESGVTDEAELIRVLGDDGHEDTKAQRHEEKTDS
jgi:type II secretory ATPase GspE/PulE/Tfp pilus assembly ATPase PilB-like protein